MTTKIITKTGNLLHVKAGHIVHGCNAQGVMGSGVALGVKNTWPEVYEDYHTRWEKGGNIAVNGIEGLELGHAYPVEVTDTLVVWNAITQNLYGAGTRQVSYDAVETCFAQVNKNMHDRLEFDAGLIPPHVHIPMIGAARGGGNWNIIKTIIEETVDFPVTLWLPDNTVTTL